MKRIWIVLVILLATASLASAGIVAKDSLDLGEQDRNWQAGVTTLCIDGLKFVFAYKWASEMGTRGVGAGGDVSLVQVYEERGGKVVPATCR